MASDRPTLETNPPGRKQNGPFVVSCQPGKFAWCRCEGSGRYPMCDGTHRGTDTKPVKVVFEQPSRVAFCACGRTATPPFCDGAHARSSNAGGSPIDETGPGSG